MEMKQCVPEANLQEPNFVQSQKGKKSANNRFALFRENQISNPRPPITEEEEEEKKNLNKLRSLGRDFDML